MRTILDYRSLCCITTVIVFVGSHYYPAFAQPPAPSARPFMLQLDVANEELFKTDLKNGPGEIESAHREFGLSIVVPQPAQRARWIASGTREYSTYRISGVETIDGDLRETYRTELRTLYFRQLEGAWSINAGLGLRWHAEQGATLADAFMYDIMLGANYRYHDRLRIGLSFLYFTRLEESALFIPAPSIEWDITERLTLRTGRDVGLHYTVDKRGTWTASWVVGYYTRSIRMKNDGITEGGASRDTYVASQWSLQYRPHPGLFAKVNAGWIPWRTLRLTDQNESTVFRGKLEPAPMVSFQAGISF
jgi:hypothetical protein